MRNNAGGHYNHELFWQLMKPAPSTTPSGTLADAINKTFGSFADFQKVFGEAAKARFGSGWAWLLVKNDGSLAGYRGTRRPSPPPSRTAPGRR